MIRRPASLHTVPRCCQGSRASSVLSGRCDFLPFVPPRFVAFAWRCRRCVRCFAPAPWQTREDGPRLVWVRPADAGVCLRRKRQELPSSWRTLTAPSPGSSTPAGPLRLTINDAVTRPPWRKRQGLLHCSFRGSIPRLWCSLSTLRPGSHPPRTQDSLPAAGQALPDGIFTRRVQKRGFRNASYISSSSPKLAWRNSTFRADATHIAGESAVAQGIAA